MNKQQLANKIWESANKMRSKIEANEYKDYILGFIFYKYLSDQEERFLKKEEFSEEEIKTLSEDDVDTMEYIRTNMGYFIAYQDLFSTWIRMGADFSVDNVRTALSAFSRLINPSHKRVFDGIFNTLETGLSKLGDSSGTQTKAISNLIHLIKDIPMDGKQDYDVLGFIYEYLISMYAANAGKKAGEFYTPHEVSVLMSEIVAYHLKDRTEIKIYDPTSGSGSLLINIGHATAKHMPDADKIKYYAQELKQNTYNLTRMNLVMRGILPDNIVTRNGDTLEEDWPYFDENDPVGTYHPLYVDAVVSNPPYSQNWDPTGKDTDPRYARFGLAPKSKADYAFLLHDLYHLKPDGIMTIVLPHGVLFRGGEEGEIRKNLVENNHIDAIIGLPANIFFGTGIPTIIMVLRQKRENTDVLIIDASKDFEKVGKNNHLRACDIRKIVDTYIQRGNQPKYSRKISREEIRENEYNLNIPRYVDSSEAPENWDIYASMYGGIPVNELEALSEYWKAFPNLKNEILEPKNGPYMQLKVSDLKSAIRESIDVSNFKAHFTKEFETLQTLLECDLIGNAEHVEIPKEEDRISEDIFRRLENIPLVDKYEAYQILDEEWKHIAVDLEMIQTEGIGAVTQVDPNMVLKKKNGKEEEVQEGWKGHILPFDLVQKICLKEESAQLQKKSERLSEIASEYEEILDSFSEDDKQAANDALNDSNDAFVIKNISVVMKTLKSDSSEENRELIQQLAKVESLSREEKQLKAAIKTDAETLHIMTKETIEGLSEDAVQVLLKEKWITPMISAFTKLPEIQVDKLTSALQALADKYADTLADLEQEIRTTEASLTKMLDELVGDDYDMEGIRELRVLLGGDVNE
ncbi:MAG: type I restriction-modification system subunit M [Agathobacter sp.]|nr:type I restriction-modification system subunit M [Agathobacter sp.]